MTREPTIHPYLTMPRVTAESVWIDGDNLELIYKGTVIRVPVSMVHELLDMASKPPVQ